MTEQEKIRDNLWRTYYPKNKRPGEGWFGAIWRTPPPRVHDGQHWVTDYNNGKLVFRGLWEWSE